MRHTAALTRLLAQIVRVLANPARLFRFPLLSRPGARLPRVLCWFDDVANAIGRVRGLAASRAIPAAWNDQMYAWHLFDHPLDDRHVLAEAESYVAPPGDT